MSATAGEAFLLRSWLAGDADRLAQLVTWGVYGAEDALPELQFSALYRAEAGQLHIDAAAFARAFLAERIEAHVAHHRQNWFAMRAAAQAAAHRGQQAAAEAAVAVARSAPLHPPPSDVHSAIRSALRPAPAHA